MTECMLRVLPLGGAEHQNAPCNCFLSYISSVVQVCQYLGILGWLIVSAELSFCYTKSSFNLIYSGRWVEMELLILIRMRNN